MILFFPIILKTNALLVWLIINNLNLVFKILIIIEIYILKYHPKFNDKSKSFIYFSITLFNFIMIPGDNL